MKEFFSSKSFKILIATILILFGFILYSVGTGENFISSSITLITAPIQKVSSFVTNKRNGILSNKETTEQLELKISQLESEVRSLRAQTVDYYDVKKENAQFAKYYEIKQKDNSLKFVPASVIGRDPNENFYGFTLDEGSLYGIKENDPVITENGLVGWVYHVDASSCKVKTILSSETKVGGVDSKTSDSGVITGNIKLASQNLTKFTYISSLNTIQPGDILVTSGLSGIYPKNLQIGQVVEFAHEEYDATVYAVVKPFEDIRAVKDVFIVTDFNGKQS